MHPHHELARDLAVARGDYRTAALHQAAQSATDPCVWGSSLAPGHSACEGHATCQLGGDFYIDDGDDATAALTFCDNCGDAPAIWRIAPTLPGEPAITEFWCHTCKSQACGAGDLEGFEVRLATITWR
jgi:hypothetical protein